MERFIEPKFNKIIINKEPDGNDKNKAKFTIEKLERGFANTIGTSMRRTMISSIPGLSAFAIEIKGINHEFQSIPHSNEDVVELILNLKKLVLIAEAGLDIDEIYKLELTSKKGTVTAKQIKLPTGIKIVNPDLILAETSKDRAIQMTIYANYSKGYKTFTEMRDFVEAEISGNIGIIPIDANYSPVVKVAYKVEEVNPGESRVFERLVLDVETNGALLPEKAVAYAAFILKTYYSTFEDMTEINNNDLFEEEKLVVEEKQNLSIPIETLNLSSRSEKWLLNSDIKTVEKLISFPVSELKNIDNLGYKSITEIIQVVQGMGLTFKSE